MDSGLALIGPGFGMGHHITLRLGTSWSGKRLKRVFVLRSIQEGRERRNTWMPATSAGITWRDLSYIRSMNPATTTSTRRPLIEAGDRSALLLAWYDRHRRKLPWRAPAGARADPYRVWLSEIMLQQTTVKAVGPYFEKFVARWPDVRAMARASLDDVLRMWAGLGYYSRARNLHACAQKVARDHGGVFPNTEEGLRALPGIGPYTAAAIAATAFDRHTMPVDGNIERVVSRLFAVEDALPQAKPRIQELAATLLGPSRAGDS